MAASPTHDRKARTTTETSTWAAGGAAGFAAGVVMGITLQLMMTPVITTAIPAMYGLEGLAVGWIAHLFHSVVFGLVFAAVVTSVPSLSGYADSVGASAGLGVVYGALVWVVAAGFVMPIWLSAVGFPGAPPLPNFDPTSLVGHAVYGLVLGALFPALRNR